MIGFSEITKLNKISQGKQLFLAVQRYFNLMTKLLLLSDTHNHIDDVILKYAKQADEI